MALGPVTSFRALWHIFRQDIRGPKDSEDEFRHPGDTRQHPMPTWIASYFWQIVELLYPTAFFPVNYALPLDRLDEDRLFPSMDLVGQANLTEPWDFKKAPGSHARHDGPEGLPRDMWRETLVDGITVRQRFNFALADLPPGDERVTMWEENQGGQVDKRPIGAGVCSVGGNLGPALGFEPHPQFVSHIQVSWLEQVVRVVWQTESSTLESRWPTLGDFIFAGVADAGLAEGFVSLWQSPKQYLDKGVHPMPHVSTTRRAGSNLDQLSWGSRPEVLPCIEEPCKWSPVAEQWRRRAMRAVEFNAVHKPQTWGSRIFRRSLVSKPPFHGVGLLVTGTQPGNLAEVVPKPNLSVLPLRLAEEETEQPHPHDEELFTPTHRVQESLVEKWHSRNKPHAVPTHLCEIQDDFRLVEAAAGTDYLALSHRWGEFEDEKLKAAIREVASELNVQHVWVDTWCIPADPEKKAFEISRMGEYYSEASAVLVMLLGVEAQTTYTDLRHGVPFDLHKARAQDVALAREISQSEWKSRVWTIQEGLLAQNCIVKTKTQILDGEYLDHLLHLPDHCRRGRWAALGNTYSKGSPLVNVRGVWSSHGFDVYGCTFGNRPWWSNGRRSSVVDVPNKSGLLEALKLGRGRKCALKVDYVIGLLGLVQGRIPPLAAGRDNWQSIWTKLVQNRIAGPDVLSSESVCDDMRWAPAAIDESNPLMHVAIRGELAQQDLVWTENGVEVTGTPMEVVVGDDATDTNNLRRPLQNEKHVTLLMAGGEELRTWAQVLAETGTTFAGLALPDQGLDKGVLVLLGKWAHTDEERPRFIRHTCMNTVRCLKLVENIQAPRKVLISNN